MATPTENKPKIRVARGARAFAKITVAGFEMSLEGKITDVMGKSLKIEFNPITLPVIGTKLTPPAQWFDLSKPADFAKVTFERL